jgi:hypothetical protein
MSDIKNPGNQVHRAANGRYYVLWRGVLVSGADGVRLFNTEHEAQEFLAQCEAANRATGPDLAPGGFQNQVYPNPRRPRRMPA